MATVLDTQAAVERTVCARHPHVPTSLHCNRCNHPICARCAIRTAVGYKCPTCIRQMQDTYFNGKQWDYLLAITIALPLSLLATLLFSLMSQIPWFPWFLLILATPMVAGFIAEVVYWGVGKRRSRYLAHVVAGSLVMAGVPFLVMSLIINLLSSSLFLNSYDYGLLGPGILMVVGVGTIMARLR